MHPLNPQDTAKHSKPIRLQARIACVLWDEEERSKTPVTQLKRLDQVKVLKEKGELVLVKTREGHRGWALRDFFGEVG